MSQQSYDVAQAELEERTYRPKLVRGFNAARPSGFISMAQDEQRPHPEVAFRGTRPLEPVDQELPRPQPMTDRPLPITPLKPGGIEVVQSPSGASIDVKAWDVFRLLPPRPDDLPRGFWVDLFLQLLKLLTYPIVFILMLASAVAAKATFLLMTSNAGQAGKNVTVCGHVPGIDVYVNVTVTINHQHVVKYIWGSFLALCAPEVFCFIRCLHRVFFRNVHRPSVGQFFLSFFVETLTAGGTGTLVFYILPNVDAISGVMFMSSLFIIPSILGLMSRKVSRLAVFLIVVDLFCIAGQTSGAWAWPAFVPHLKKHAWAYPLAGVLISLGWWENYVSKDSLLPCIRKLGDVADGLKQVRSRTYIFVAPWKCAIYFTTLFAFTSFQMSASQLFEHNPFDAKPIDAILHKPPEQSFTPPTIPDESHLVNNFGFANDHWSTRATDDDFDIDRILSEANPSKNDSKDSFRRSKRQTPYDYETRIFHTRKYDAVYVFLISVLIGFFCYQSAKFACKVTIQRFAFALPLSLTSPLLVGILHTLCYHRDVDPCFLTEVMPYEIFWSCPARPSTAELLQNPQTWFWVIWVVSEMWVAVHIWFPKCERLADTDRLFVMPWYSGILIDQGLMLNRRRSDNIKIKTEEMELEQDDQLYDTVSTDLSSIKSVNTANKGGGRSTDNITRIYACATMWHETREEMLYMLKSIFRMDEDQCARRNAQKYLKIVDPDYYEFEAHIIFDDAFETNEYGEPQVNMFVRQLLEVVDIAAGAVHQTTMRIKAPKKHSTPYGGQLVWTLPGKNKLTVHMKDKNKIRVRKRWSQVMYMYYLLGFRLMEKVGDTRRKETLAENTYILTLDGDVDFQPEAVQLLVDLMKKNRRLGAACGRIHPRGSGPMVWYQKFEYAIGHWFQKATEHMIGCVLCSPGCFSLFRASALMDDDVLRRYATKAEQATDYIQYDQGEDRWLCTLLLQRGYRVEYSAASDALTFAPQSFSEFFNQRRRWMPSTVANIVDLLKDHKSLSRINDSISGWWANFSHFEDFSSWYIGYQFAMLMSSVLGPGTIFLMVAGAVNISFSNSTSASFIFVLLPVLFFLLVCFTCKPNVQIIVAQVISAWFAMLMMAVIVGTALQIKKDGLTSPHAMFLLFLVGSCIVAALLHPLEFTCIFPGIIYFLAVPCTYMLLSIYSVCNLNVVSWGTREVAKQDGKTKKGKQVHLLDNTSLTPAELDGVYSVGCGNTCRFLCCLQPSALAETPQMVRIMEKLEGIDKRIDRFDRRVRRPGSGVADPELRLDNQPLLEEDEEEIQDDNFDLPYHQMQKDALSTEKAAQSEAWLNDRCLRSAEREVLEPEEERFWVDLKEKYLYPLKEDKKRFQIQADLMSLRNQISFGFLMCNALFILVVFLLQLKKDCLNVEWPLGEKVNRTMVPCNSETGEEESVLVGLQLEPIGFVFLFFFMSLLVIQFIAMLLHRFGTLSHIIASTELCCRRRTIDKLTDDELMAEHFVEIAKELQAIRGVDDNGSMIGNDDEPENMVISRREIVKRLENSRKSQMNSVKRTETLDAAFRKRFFNLQESQKLPQRASTRRRSGRLTMRHDTIRAVQHRRDKIYGTLDGPPKEIQAVDSSITMEEGNPRGPSRRRVDQIFRGGRSEHLNISTTDGTSVGDNSDEDSFLEAPPVPNRRQVPKNHQKSHPHGPIITTAKGIPLQMPMSDSPSGQRRELLKKSHLNGSTDSGGSQPNTESHL